MSSQVITEIFPVIKQVESHLTWIDDILSELGKQTPNLSKIDYVHLVLRTYNYEYFEKKDGGVQSESEYRRNDSYEFEEDYNEESPKYANLFAKIVNKCAKILYIGERLDCIPLKLKELREIVANLNGDHKRLEGAFEYCIEALEWSLEKLQCKEADGDVGDLHILQKKWKELKNGSKSLAALIYLKATLRVEFQMGEVDMLYSRLLPETIELDPEYHIWHHNLYTSMRNVRKLLGFSEGGLMEAPSEEEIKCCNRQLELAPNLLLSNVDMALLQKDILWMVVYKRQKHFASRVKDIDVDVDAVYQRCMQYFDIALRLAEQNKLQKWTMKIEYEKAEMMIHVKDSETIRSEGLNTFSQLLETFPNDAILHYKVGRLYLYGVFHDNVVLLRNSTLAEEHFKRALQLRGYDFFPCLRDYVKSYKFLPHPLPVKELWTILENCKHAFEKRCCDSRVYKVQIWKAFVLWIYNPEDSSDNKRLAARMWLDALREYEDQKMHRDNIFRPISQPPFAAYREVDGQIKKVSVEINLKELRNELILIMNDEFIELESSKNAEIFINEIDKLHATRLQFGGVMRSMSEFTAKRTRKLTKFQADKLDVSSKNTNDADSDMNWRKK